MRLPINRIGLCVVLLSPSQASAVSIANQMPSDQANGTVSGDMIFIGTTRVADEFTIPASLDARDEREKVWGITRLRGTLIASLSVVGSSAGFDVFKHGDNNLPGSTIPHFTSLATSAVQVGLWKDSLPIVEFSIGDGVTPLFTAFAGETFWLSLFGRGSGAGEVAYFASYQAAGPAIGLNPAFLSADLGYPEWVRLSSISGGAPRSFAFAVEGELIPGQASILVLTLASTLLTHRRRD